MLSGCSGRRNGKIHRPKLLFLGKIAKIGGLNCYLGCLEGKRVVRKAKELSGRQKSCPEGKRAETGREIAILHLWLDIHTEHQ